MSMFEKILYVLVGVPAVVLVGVSLLGICWVIIDAMFFDTEAD